MEDKLAKNRWKLTDTAEEKVMVSEVVSEVDFVEAEEEVEAEDREEVSGVVVVSVEDSEIRLLPVTGNNYSMCYVFIIIVFIHNTNEVFTVFCS